MELFHPTYLLTGSGTGAHLECMSLYVMGFPFFFAWGISAKFWIDGYSKPLEKKMGGDLDEAGYTYISKKQIFVLYKNEKDMFFQIWLLQSVSMPQKNLNGGVLPLRNLSHIFHEKTH